MEVFRKPGSTRWHTESVQSVSRFELDAEPWCHKRTIDFDATKDRSKGRFTEMKMTLTEKDVELLYAGLCEGRKKRIALAGEAGQAMEKIELRIWEERRNAPDGSAEKQSLFQAQGYLESWMLDYYGSLAGEEFDYE